MSISPINGGAILQFPRTHGMPMTLGQPTMSINSAAAAAAAVHAVAQQRMAVTDSTIAKRNATNAQKRANHNAIERARRECLNSKFQELAHSIPALSQVRRPSKSVIVQKSLEYIYTSKQRNEEREREVRSVKNENMTLREEVTRLRRTLGLSPLPERPPTKSPELEDRMIDGIDVSRTTSNDSSTGSSASDILGNGLMHAFEDNEDEFKSESCSPTPHHLALLHQHPSTPTAAVFPGMLHEQHGAMDAVTAAAAAAAVTVGPMPGFLDYMHADISGAMSPVGQSFVNPLGFPTNGVTPTMQSAMEMYNTPLSLATTAAAMAAVHAASPMPTQQLFLPSPSEDVFNMNELMMAGCIEHSNASVAAAAAAVAAGGVMSARHIVEPHQIQTPPLQ